MSERPSRRFNIRYWGTAGGLLGAWLLFGYVIVPRLIRSAYEGTSFGFLNRAISGQGTNPVERYLAVAASAVSRVTIALVVLALAGYAAWVWRAPLRRIWNAVTRQGALGSGRDLALTALWLGLFFGFTETALAWIRFRALGVVTVFNDPSAFWTAPLGLGLLFGIGALALVTLLGGWKRELSFRPFVAVGVFLGIYSLILGLQLGLPPLQLGIHPLAIAVLALAIAVQTTRWVESKPGARRWLRVTALPLAAVFLVVPLVAGGLGRLVEGRRMAGLPEATPDMPNVILIVLDTVRKQSMGLHGYGRPNTPELEELAAHAAVFERAIATSSWTLPTHGSLFTGRYQYELSTDRQEPLDEAYPTLAEFLGQAGYASAGFVANLDYTTTTSGLARGFIHYSDHAVTWGSLLTGNWLLRKIGQTIWRWRRQGPNRKYAPMVVDEFLAWRDGIEDRPYFAFLNLYDAHAPYEIHEEFLETFPPERPIRTVTNADGVHEPLTPDLARAIDGYDTGIALMDRAIGRMLDDLEARGELDNTLLIITSDHGEHLGDHGMWDHHNSLYTQLVLVPLMVSVPDGAGSGLRIETPVTLRDVPATVVDLVGLPGSPFPGESLARTWRDTTAAGPGDPVLSEVSGSGLGDVWPHEPIYHGPMKSLVEGSLHYIQNGDGSEELYDLALDPEEETDIADTERGELVLPRFRDLVEPIIRADTLVYSDAYIRSGKR